MWTATASATARCPAPIIPPASYFTRGSGHNEKAQYTEREDDYINNMDRLAHKFEVMRTARARSRWCEIAEGAKIGFVAFGTSRLRGARKLRPVAAPNTRSTASYLRLQGVSVHRSTCSTSSAATTASTWWTRTATRQLLGLMRLEFDADLIAKLRSVRYYGGLPLDARTVTDEIVRQEGK